MTHHEFQYQRMMRYFHRLEQIEFGVKLGSERRGDDCIDDIFAFFLNCYHLKDWLKNDPAFTKRTKQQVEDYVKTTPCLLLCADICHATKHLMLRGTRSGSVPRFEDINLTAFEGGPLDKHVAYQLVIEHAGKKQTALAIARECVRAWDSFLL